jgi:hypothetical protein
MVMDKITEAIAHFVGLFHLAAEEARQRSDYETFQSPGARANDPAELLPITPEIDPSHVLEDFYPALRYAGPAPILEELGVEVEPGIPFYDIPGPWSFLLDRLAEYWVPGWSPMPTPFDIDLAQLTPPGSAVVVISQYNTMLDNDYVGIGTEGLVFKGIDGLSAEMTSFAARAAALSPLGALETPGSVADMIAFVTTLPGRLDAFLAEDGNAANIVARDDSLNGRFVNGAMVDETPDLAAHRLPRPEKAERPDPRGDEPDLSNAGMSNNPGKSANASFSQNEGKLQLDPSVELDAGSNTLINEVLLTNKLLSGTAFAVLGDSHEVNAIFQVNAWSDQDVAGDAIQHWTGAARASSDAFNIATFEREDARSDGISAQTGFPKGWAVTRIDGDLIFLNWIEQINLMSDNDVAMMTSTGVNSVVSTGGNHAYDGVSLTEFGFHYDLIIVAGGMYDANIIDQLNVLLDNDFVGAVDAFETSGPGKLSTSGNLLWNEATISTIGAAARFDTLPDIFREAAQGIARGDKNLPEALFTDSAFIGLAGLRVLYVSGNIVDLQYISQTNILGDSDQVALAMNSLKPTANAAWKVATGGNELINHASIKDLDSKGKSYVGGGHYSDELLLQAELVDFNPKLQRWDADKIVSEAIAFLDDDIPQWHGKDVTPWGSLKGFFGSDAHDGVHSMLA